MIEELKLPLIYEFSESELSEIHMLPSRFESEEEIFPQRYKTSIVSSESSTDGSSSSSEEEIKVSRPETTICILFSILFRFKDIYSKKT